jgi:hypothetical protein
LHTNGHAAGWGGWSGSSASSREKSGLTRHARMRCPFLLAVSLRPVAAGGEVGAEGRREILSRLSGGAGLGEGLGVEDQPALAGLAASNADQAIAFWTAGNQLLVVAAPAIRG